MLSAWAVAVNTGFTKMQESLLQSAPAGARPDDDHVGHKDGEKCASVGTIMRGAASISARWENACGKFPRCLRVSGSNSSA